MQSPYEITPQERTVGTIGRAMMDYSETTSMAGLSNPEIHVYNILSELGYKMTQVGRTFGPTQKDFTDRDMEIIAQWNKGWRPKPGRKPTRTTY